MKKHRYWTIWIAFLFLVLVISSYISLLVGPSKVSLGNAIRCLIKGKRSMEYTIVFDLRLPRVLLGVFVGGCLSISGVILQGLFRNPLVEPYTLGISGGSALGVAISIASHLTAKFGGGFLVVSGFLGALLVIILLYLINLRKEVVSAKGLLLTGVMISFMSSSLIMLIMAISRAEDIQSIVLWIMGSLESADWTYVKILAPSSVLGLVLSYFLAMDLNALSLGEEEALHLGVNVERVKKLVFFLASLLTGLSVAVSGIIGFIGLVVPHFSRMLIGEDHRILLMSSFLMGGAFLVVSDMVARTIISPLELPVGVVTGIVGGGLFIYVLTKKEVTLGD